MLWMFIFRLNGSVMAGRVVVSINIPSLLPDQGLRQVYDFQMEGKTEGAHLLRFFRFACMTIGWYRNHNLRTMGVGDRLATRVITPLKKKGVAIHHPVSKTYRLF